jgi:protocatechuate 3,4-dioxygenase beta subunit
MTNQRRRDGRREEGTRQITRSALRDTSNGRIVAETTTNASGQFTFTGLNPGGYR